MNVLSLKKLPKLGAKTPYQLIMKPNNTKYANLSAFMG